MGGVDSNGPKTTVYQSFGPICEFFYFLSIFFDTSSIIDSNIHLTYGI
jgi:hypothetical protein